MKIKPVTCLSTIHTKLKKKKERKTKHQTELLPVSQLSPGQWSPTGLAGRRWIRCHSASSSHLSPSVLFSQNALLDDKLDTPKRKWVQKMLPKCSPRQKNQCGCRSGSREGGNLPRKTHLNLSQKNPKALSLTSHQLCLTLLLTKGHLGLWSG